MFNLYNYFFKKINNEKEGNNNKKEGNNNKKEGNNNKKENNNEVDYFKLKKEFENNECIICLDEMVIGEYIKTLKCGHIYHNKCINEWFNIKKICPICSI